MLHYTRAEHDWYTVMMRMCGQYKTKLSLILQQNKIPASCGVRSNTSDVFTSFKTSCQLLSCKKSSWPCFFVFSRKSQVFCGSRKSQVFCGCQPKCFVVVVWKQPTLHLVLTNYKCRENMPHSDVSGPDWTVGTFAKALSWKWCLPNPPLHERADKACERTRKQ